MPRKYPLFYNPVNLITYTAKISINLLVVITEYENVISPNLTGTDDIVFLCGFFIVLTAIQFNGDSCFIAVEIYNVSFNDALLIKFHWMDTEKAVP